MGNINYENSLYFSSFTIDFILHLVYDLKYFVLNIFNEC